MTAALFGLLGVLVGGLLQFLRDHGIESARRNRELLGAARAIGRQRRRYGVYGAA
jgi:hypothetical protein